MSTHAWFAYRVLVAIAIGETIALVCASVLARLVAAYIVGS